MLSETILFKNSKYAIYSNGVTDEMYGGKADPAYTPDGNSIHSSFRFEEANCMDLSSREWGEWPHYQVFILNKDEWWKPQPEISRFAALKTKHTIIDAVYKLALDVLHRCSSGEFMRTAGEEGLWQAGYRRGEGYGVWIRDVCYTALWSGSFLDRKKAERSIAYVTNNGIDNGEDGLAMPAIAAWNHFLITGEKTLFEECYNHIKSSVEKISFDENKALGVAKWGSFLDSFDATEITDGFPLSTNILYQEAYRTMAFIGKMMKESPSLVENWEKRSADMRNSLSENFWKEEEGFFAMGPKGSQAYRHNYWENLGISLMLWPQWKLATREQRLAWIQAKNRHFLNYRNDYGFPDLDFRKGDCLHGRQLWIFTLVGQAAAFAAEKKADELMLLLASTIRSAAIHKTFYECIDFDTGKSWRYPGQLWHAMGFISMITFGVLGIEYDEEGLYFANTCVPKPFEDMSFTGLSYRNATLNITAKGWGSLETLLLDGNPVEKIDTELSGEHKIELLLSEK